MRKIPGLICLYFSLRKAEEENYGFSVIEEFLRS
jgi:hypothetical protein